MATNQVNKIESGAAPTPIYPPFIVQAPASLECFEGSFDAAHLVVDDTNGRPQGLLSGDLNVHDCLNIHTSYALTTTSADTHNYTTHLHLVVAASADLSRNDNALLTLANRVLLLENEVLALRNERVTIMRDYLYADGTVNYPRVLHDFHILLNLVQNNGGQPLGPGSFAQ